MNIIEAVILAIVEGITEYLPVSSTGHMVVTSTLMGIARDDFTKFFTVAIQLGAILSVIVLYRKRFCQTRVFYYKLACAFIPAVIFGFLFSGQIDSLLENTAVVGIMLIIGGFIFLFVDKWFSDEKASSEGPGYKNAFIIGCFQILAMVPGVSRSAATIIGGLTQKLTRKSAAEFSFFLAVPTMFVAAAKKTFDYYNAGLRLNTEQMQMLAIGNVVAFIVAMIAIKSFIALLTRHGFRIFGGYRIVAGTLVLLMGYFGVHF